MALSGLDIFKKLPKTNCGECGFPTCMAFAMKLAARQSELDKCPYVSDEARDELSEASAPPIRKVEIGSGENAFKIGEETVMFRHEKTFVNPPGFGVLIDDSADETAIASVAKKVDDVSFERIEQMLKPKVVALRNSSGSADKFVAAVKAIQSVTSAPLVLMSTSVDSLRAALGECAANRPLIHAADASNYEAMAGLAKEFNVPLAIKADDLAALADLSEKVQAAGVKDIVLDPSVGAGNAGLADVVRTRRAALKQKFKPLGFPFITFPALASDDPDVEMALAGVHLMKYAGLIILSDLDPARVLPLLVLLQNIYTDPQKPMQMSQGIYQIGEPKDDSPVLITTNFSLTYFIVSGEVEASRVPAWLCVMDVEGLSVLTAWAAGKFVPEKIAQFVNKSAVADKVKHRKLVLPGYVAQISGELDEELPEWQVAVGPREAGDLPHYLKQWSA